MWSRKWQNRPRVRAAYKWTSEQFASAWFQRVSDIFYVKFSRKCHQTLVSKHSWYRAILEQVLSNFEFCLKITISRVMGWAMQNKKETKLQLTGNKSKKHDFSAKISKNFIEFLMCATWSFPCTPAKSRTAREWERGRKELEKRREGRKNGSIWHCCTSPDYEKRR